MNAEVKVARPRLSVRELAEKLGNVSEACRRCQARNDPHPALRVQEALRDLRTGRPGRQCRPSPRAIRRPRPTSWSRRSATPGASTPQPRLQLPGALLGLEGIDNVSALTIQKILNEHELGSKFDRWLALEHQHAEAGLALTVEQVAYL